MYIASGDLEQMSNVNFYFTQEDFFTLFIVL